MVKDKKNPFFVILLPLCAASLQVIMVLQDFRFLEAQFLLLSLNPVKIKLSTLSLCIQGISIVTS